MTPNPYLFAPLLLASLAIFALACWKRLSLISLGRPEERFDNLGTRFSDMLLYAFGQKRVVAKPFGINHFIIFWSFLIRLLIDNRNGSCHFSWFSDVDRNCRR